MTTTLWDFPSQNYGEGSQGDQDYIGATPSYLIWSIFTKEREERRREKEKRKKERLEQGDKRSNSPLSAMPLEPADNFHNTLMNAKLVELEKEVAHFQKESQALAVGRRKLQTERKKFNDDVAEFERRKEIEKKKAEEEKRRLRRDRMLLDKAQKDRKSTDERKAFEEIDDLQNKVIY